MSMNEVRSKLAIANLNGELALRAIIRMGGLGQVEQRLREGIPSSDAADLVAEIRQGWMNDLRQHDTQLNAIRARALQAKRS